MHGDTSVHDSSAQEDVLVARAWQGCPVIRALFPLMGCACSRVADAGAGPPHPPLRANLPPASLPAAPLRKTPGPPWSVLLCLRHLSVDVVRANGTQAPE